MRTVVWLLCVCLLSVCWLGCGNKPAAPTPSHEAPAAAPAPAPTPPAAPTAPALPETIRVESPDFGVLTMNVPTGAQTDTPKPVPGTPTRVATVKFSSGAITQLQITVLGPSNLMPGFGSDAWLKGELEKWSAGLKGKTVESELKPETLESDSVRGYYTSATDANPAPGQSKYLVNGFFRASTGVFMLGGLSNDAAGAKTEFLAVAKTAKWEEKPASAAAKPDEPQSAGK